MSFYKKIKFRSSGYETMHEFEDADKRGFSKKVDEEKAKAMGFRYAQEWELAILGGFDNKEEYDIARAAGFSTKSKMEEARIRGFETAWEMKHMEIQGYSSQQEYDEAIEKLEKGLIQIEEDIKAAYATRDRLINNIENITLDLSNNPSNGEVDEKLQFFVNEIQVLKANHKKLRQHDVTMIVKHANKAEHMEKYTSLLPRLMSLSNEYQTLEEMLEETHERWYAEALKKRRSFRLDRIIKRVTSMSLVDFAKEMEYNDLDQLKQWLIYELSDDIPITLDNDAIQVDRGRKDNDITTAIDEMLSQFMKLEENKHGKWE
ncbi:MAG: hypothetical protein INQ03_08035 [Candidatus Heimdallarchaeota archaeon]|nr:hypothetical protein [Candidatus Heimdallarchaeota archaeon]